jgi:hypothetical protein
LQSIFLFKVIAKQAILYQFRPHIWQNKTLIAKTAVGKERFTSATSCPNLLLITLKLLF